MSCKSVFDILFEVKVLTAPHLDLPLVQYDEHDSVRSNSAKVTSALPTYRPALLSPLYVTPLDDELLGF